MKTEQVIKLCDEKMRLQRKAYKTRQSYCGWIRRYCNWMIKTKPVGESTQKMELYLTYLAKNRKVAATTQNQAFNALLFLYRDVRKEKLGNINALRAKTPKVERHAPSVEEITAVLGCLKDRNGFPVRLVFKLLYGCGMRVSEPLNLRIKDIRFDRGEIIIRDAKGGNDRVVSIPPCLVDELRVQVEAARVVWNKDHVNNQPHQLPNAYARKAPSAAFEWGWAFLFPGHVPVEHPDTGEMVRYHFHQSNVQRAVREACEEAELSTRFTPHNLRHSYATHALDNGSNIHDVKEVLGHKNVETTMIYLHAEIGRVRSPLERIAI